MAATERQQETDLARSLFDEANDAYFLIHPRDQRIVDVNPTAQRLTSFERKELCSLRLGELFSSIEREGLEQLAQAFQGPHFFHSREGYYLQRKRHAPLAVNVSASRMATAPEPLGLVVARDVDERKRLVESLQLLQFSLDQSSIAIFWLDQDARILHANQASCRMLDYSMEDLVKQNVYDICPDCLPERCAGYWKKLKEVGRRTYLARMRTRGGRIIPVEVTAQYLPFGGKELQFTYVQDISERVKADCERRELEAQVAQAQKLESLGVMAGGIAHDFNNRLTVILGNAILAQSLLDADSPLAGHLQQVVQAGRSAADLCQHLLAYTGKSIMPRAMVSLNALVEGLERTLPAEAARTTVLHYQLTAPAPVIQADEGQLRQAVVHLTTNAAESLGPQGGSITVSTGTMNADRAFLDQLTLGADMPEGPSAWIEVADTGCGMDRDTLAKMFEPFFSTKFLGRGLGLSMVFGAVRGHRGAIQITSELGRGTTFRLLFPMSLMTEEEGADLRLPNLGTAANNGTILVVEDEPGVRALMQRVLEQQGYRCLLTDDGDEAIHVFKAQHDAIDIVLLDLTMPRMDGEATFHELRSLDPNVRVILCTGYDVHQAAERLMERGISGVLQKPYTPSQLVSAVQAVLAQPSA